MSRTSKALEILNLCEDLIELDLDTSTHEDIKEALIKMKDKMKSVIDDFVPEEDSEDTLQKLKISYQNLTNAIKALEGIK